MKPTQYLRAIAALVGTVVVGAALASAPELVSVNSAGTATANQASPSADISADGRYVAFASRATDLVTAPPDAGATSDIFRRDLATGTTVLVSRNLAGTAPGNGLSAVPLLSADGRYVAFQSYATDLTAGADTNGGEDVFLRDMMLGTTIRVSSNVAHTGAANSLSSLRGMSPDGRFVLFESDGTDFTTTPDTNNDYDLFLYDRQSGAVEMISVNRFGAAAGNSGTGGSVCLTDDGRYVVFASSATDHTALPDANGFYDLYRRDRVAQTTALVSVNASGTAAGNGESSATETCMSADGRYIAFTSFSSDLSPLDPDSFYDAYVRDMTTGTTELASVDAAGTGPGGASTQQTLLSRDGRFVTMATYAATLVSPPTGGLQVFQRDRQLGKTRLVSHAADGAPGNGPSRHARVSADAGTVVFESAATNLAGGADGNGDVDVFIWDAGGDRVAQLSTTAAGNAGNLASSLPHLSADGRVSFVSLATDFATADGNMSDDVFVVRTRLFANGFE